MVQKAVGVAFAGASVSLGMNCGPYRLARLLGAGGMGSVYLAERTDGEVRHQVAVKFLQLAVDTVTRDRFLRERQILATLNHPGIAGLIDAGHTTDGRPYVVMDYVDGTPIHVYAGKLDLEGKIRLFLKVCEAISHAHANLVVHRDIKPSNLLIDAAGNPKLLDFGIAKLLEDSGSLDPRTLLTKEQGAPLTPEYAAPEQLTGGNITTATDIYALGVLLFVLLTGQHPAGPGPHSTAELVKAIVDTEPPLPSKVAGEMVAGHGAAPDRLRRMLRGDLDTIVVKALKKNPRDRYPSVAAMADDLHRHLRNEPITARPDTFAYRTAKFVRRNQAVLIVALLVGAAGIGGVTFEALRVRAQRDFALFELSRAEAINDLNSFLLSDAAPSGKPFTVNDLLGRAEHILERQHDARTANRVELLVSIGHQYFTQDEETRAANVLADAYRLSRELPEPSARAEASCAYALVLAHGGDLPRAETLIQEGLRELDASSAPAGLGRLHLFPSSGIGEPRFVFDRISCLLNGSLVARESGASRKAIARIQTARTLLDQSPLRSELMDLRVFMDLAEAYRTAGRHHEAIEAFEQASARLSALGRDDTETAGTLFNNWALSLSQVGRPLEAEKLFRRAIEISRSDRTDQAVSPFLLINYARVLQDLNQLDEAESYYKSGYARAQQTGNHVAINQALTLGVALYRRMGNFERASQLLSEVEPRLRHDLPPGHFAFAGLASERALIAQGRNDPLTAIGFADQSIAIVEAAIQAGGEGAGYLPTLLTRRSGVELELRRLEESAKDARRAVDLLQRAVPATAYSSTLGRAWQALGRALAAQGRYDEAHNAFRSAAEQLQNALGANHPDTLSALKSADAGRP